jgi:hypothetical protein
MAANRSDGCQLPAHTSQACTLRHALPGMRSQACTPRHALQHAPAMLTQGVGVLVHTARSWQEPLYPSEELRGVVPADPRQPWDVRAVLARILDGSR